MSDVFPLLKPPDWPHKSLVAHKELIENAPDVPLVAFGRNLTDGYVFVPREQCPDADRMYADALANLAKLDYPWTVGETGGLRFAVNSGQDFSAEKVLDAADMQRCQSLLETDSIIVAVPRRTCLCAARADLPPEQMDLFVRLMLHAYNDDSYGHAPISTAMFVLTDGVIARVAFVQ